jgi:hypothetical protein
MAQALRLAVAETKAAATSLRLLGREGFALTDAKIYATLASLYNHGVFQVGGLLQGSRALARALCPAQAHGVPATGKKGGQIGKAPLPGRGASCRAWGKTSWCHRGGIAIGSLVHPCSFEVCRGPGTAPVGERSRPCLGSTQPGIVAARFPAYSLGEGSGVRWASPFSLHGACRGITKEIGFKSVRALPQRRPGRSRHSGAAVLTSSNKALQRTLAKALGPLNRSVELNRWRGAELPTHNVGRLDRRQHFYPKDLGHRLLVEQVGAVLAAALASPAPLRRIDRRRGDDEKDMRLPAPHSTCRYPSPRSSGGLPSSCSG